MLHKTGDIDWVAVGIIVLIGLAGMGGLIFQDRQWRSVYNQMLEQQDSLQEKVSNQEEQLHQFKMYYSSNYMGEINFGEQITGVSFPDDAYFCAYVGKGSNQRGWAEVMETCGHEYLHLKNPDHFTQFAEITNR